MKMTKDQKQINKGKWKIYNRTPRRFKVVVDYMWTSCVEYEWCNYDQLNETIQKLEDKNKDNPHYQIRVFEIYDLDWESEEA